MAFQRPSTMALDLIPPPLTQLGHTHALVHVGEYAWAMPTLAPNTFTTHQPKPIATFHHLHPLVEVDLLPFVNIFIQKWILFWIKRHLFLFCHFLHSFHFTVYWVCCMSFWRIDSSPTILLLDLIFFKKYVGTLLMVMFFHKYHTYLLHCDYWFWKNNLEAFDPSPLERSFID